MRVRVRVRVRVRAKVAVRVRVRVRLRSVTRLTANVRMPDLRLVFHLVRVRGKSQR